MIAWYTPPPLEDEEHGEGCLSVPGEWFPLARHPRARVTGTDLDGNPVVVEGEGLLARCLQHETDHLDGVLFVSRLDPETRKAAMRAIREAEWSGLSTPLVKVSPH